MEFGPVPLERAEGAILAHSLHMGGLRLRKGRVLERGDLARLAEGGVREVVVARPGPGDIDENAAAARLARALVPDPKAAGLVPGAPFTGRVNLHAAAPGLLSLDAGAIRALNKVDPGITLATLPEYARLAQGTLAATVKIIPYAVEARRLEAACAAADCALALRPIMRRSAGLILTSVPGQADKLNAKGRRAIGQRLQSLGVALASSVEVAHERDAIAAALTQLEGEVILILTGSATSDIRDTAPEALRKAGGRVDRFGLPVDPGNLLFLGELNGRPVIGLPGSARSSVAHGVDRILERIICGVTIDDDDIAAMAIGGLLKEVPGRPQPREPRAR